MCINNDSGARLCGNVIFKLFPVHNYTARYYRNPNFGRLKLISMSKPLMLPYTIAEKKLCPLTVLHHFEHLVKLTYGNGYGNGVNITNKQTNKKNDLKIQMHSSISVCN